MKSASKIAMNFGLGDLQPGLEGPGLVAAAIHPVQVRDVEAARGVPAHRQLGNLGRLVRRVVQDLDLEQLARVIHLADRVDQAVRDVHLVVDRAAGRDPRQLGERRRRERRVRGLVPVLHVKINEVIAMPAVDGQDAQDEEVQNENECFSQRRHKRDESSHTVQSVILRSRSGQSQPLQRDEPSADSRPPRRGPRRRVTPEAAQERLSSSFEPAAVRGPGIRQSRSPAERAPGLP